MRSEQHALVALHVDAQLVRAHADVAAPGQLGHHDVAPVAHPLGRNVLVAVRDLLDRGDVHAALVRERGAPDVGRVRARADVGDLADRARQLGQLGQVLLGNAAPLHLQLQRGDDRDQVGVAAALAPAVDRPLHLRAAGLDAGQRVGDREIAVVVRVDAELGRDRLLHRRDDLADRAGQAAAVGVAQADPVGARVGGGLDRRQRVGPVGAEAVEEVLGVVDDLLALLLQQARRCRRSSPGSLPASSPAPR